MGGVGSGGHNRKPAEIRRLEGGRTVSHRPVPQTVLIGGRVHEFPEPPERLPEDGQELWRTLGPRLAEVGILDAVDLIAFEDLCRAHATKLAAGRVREAKGMFSVTTRGTIGTAPWVRAERAAAEECLRLYARFGLTPRDRTALGLMQLAGRTMLDDLEREIGGSEVIEGVGLGAGLPGI